MYRSLKRVAPNSRLIVYAFDRLAYETLLQLKLQDVELVPLQEFETPELLKVKPTRSRGEYCWTCTPSIILDALQRFKLKSVTYLDSDLYFYASPRSLFDEMESSGASVLITEHRYSAEYDQSKQSGIFCVQYLSVKNDDRGLAAVKWWRDRCLEWCYAYAEDGKFGDQKYLDDWPIRFEGVHVLKNLGGGVAPWNIQQYVIGEGPTVNGFPVIFFHFHLLKMYYPSEFRLVSHYALPKDAISLVYRPYVEQLKLTKQWLISNGITERFDFVDQDRSFKASLNVIKEKVLGKYYVLQE